MRFCLAENPLLPNRRLKELLELMRRCRALDSRTTYNKIPREAVLAATTIQLESGDILLGSPRDKTAAALAPAQKKNERVTWKAVIEPEADVPLPRVSPLALAAAMAHGLRASGGGGLVLALAEPGRKEPNFAQTLAYAQHARVPLLLAVADASRIRSRAGAAAKVQGAADMMSLSSVEALAHKLRVPFFPVDGEDAVAVYRVMQECTLRARNGEGPAILWGMMLNASTGKMKPAERPIARMEKYLSVRGLLPKSKAR
jgi:hypothetical protein